MSHLMYDGVRKAPHRWGTSAATIERRTDMHEQLIKAVSYTHLTLPTIATV